MREVLQVRIAKLVQGGDGFTVTEDGKALFVQGALPGELVTCEVLQEKKGYRKARLIDVLEPSADRVPPLCPYYGLCGGCNLMHLKSSSQAQVKQQIVLENLRRVGGMKDSIELDVPQETAYWGYRSRVRFHVDPMNDLIGFLAAGSNEIVNVEHCPVLVKELNELLVADGRQLLFDQAKGQRCEVSVLVGDEGLSFDSEPVAVTVQGHRFHVDAKVFFQSNRIELPSMISYVCDHAVGKSVMDLYAGVGTFSAFLESDAVEVVAVERDRRCLSYAKRNVKRTRFFTAAVEDWAKGSKEHVDTVVVDPPRVGLDAKVPAMIASWKPRRIIYVSCDSVTMARDLQSFMQEGYSPTKLSVFDFYPQTFHQETVLILDHQVSEGSR